MRFGDIKTFIYIDICKHRWRYNPRLDLKQKLVVNLRFRSYLTKRRISSKTQSFHFLCM